MITFLIESLIVPEQNVLILEVLILELAPKVLVSVVQVRCHKFVRCLRKTDIQDKRIKIYSNNDIHHFIF